MLKIQEIRELIKLIDQSSIDEFTYENEGAKLLLKKSAPEAVYSLPVQPQADAPVQAAAPAQAANHQAEQVQPKAEEKQTSAPAQDENLVKITSPMVGTFYAASSPESGNYVEIGSKVKNDSVVCIVEAMKLFNEIEAETKGEIVEILAENGQLVEYGQPLFLVKPE
ncbi:acetyl-CoA carboxylase biotin carboxyl carrier protein [Bacillus sp. FJAT-42376]|uniref:acetyl-CoA carboxylase biotin carboxyl carrier protein n=1 Tax=Bacillus sp. FJAT-42376 TaxID=2014076 RepID=UPI000F4FD1BD|nr:acetyl-CoA carboxylase biotin carboxyl carrier protein [Bacillus sp. FJAT-42376]AZB43533.1 acetyl-CoA carboxylase biotin carboxyl carrier protein [Bacillus sp. FJAT-42376]